MLELNLNYADDFRRVPKPQRNWGWSMATAFTLGEAGAGLFIVSLCLNWLPGEWTGLLVAVLGKFAGHMLHLGKPLRAWRAIARVRTSWVSRGLLAILVCAGFGFPYLLSASNLDGGLMPGGFRPVAATIAAAAALVIMLYQGLAMAQSTAISLWSSRFVPALGFVYALLAGMAIAMAAGRPESSPALSVVEMLLLALVAAMLVGLLRHARMASTGGNAAVELLLYGRLATWFTPLVGIVGIALPAVIVAFAEDDPIAHITAAACILGGYYAFRVLIFKAGLYDPLQSFGSRSKRQLAGHRELLYKAREL